LHFGGVFFGSTAFFARWILPAHKASFVPNCEASTTALAPASPVTSYSPDSRGTTYTRLLWLPKCNRPGSPNLTNPRDQRTQSVTLGLTGKAEDRLRQRNLAGLVFLDWPFASQAGADPMAFTPGPRRNTSPDLLVDDLRPPTMEASCSEIGRAARMSCDRGRADAIRRLSFACQKRRRGRNWNYEFAPSVKRAEKADNAVSFDEPSRKPVLIIRKVARRAVSKGNSSRLCQGPAEFREPPYGESPPKLGWRNPFQFGCVATGFRCNTSRKEVLNGRPCRFGISSPVLFAFIFHEILVTI